MVCLTAWPQSGAFSPHNSNGRSRRWRREDSKKFVTGSKSSPRNCRHRVHRNTRKRPRHPHLSRQKTNVTFQITRPEAYQPLSKLLKVLAAIATLVLAIAILYLALSPPTPQASVGVNDKILHFTAFMALILSSAIFLARSLVWILPLSLLFGGAIELLQPGFGRDASWHDFQADMLGVTASAILGLAFRFLIKRYVATSAATH